MRPTTIAALATVFVLAVLAACGATQDAMAPHLSQSATPRQAQIAALTSKLAWVGDLHHTAMQEALHDSAFQALTGRGPMSGKCAAQLAYMRRYLPLAEHSAGTGVSNDAQAAATITSLGAQVGTCRASLARPVARSVAQTFGYSLADSMATVRSLPAALALIDSRLSAAVEDPLLGPDDLEQMVAVSVLARSSANEWFSYFAGGPRVIPARAAMGAADDAPAFAILSDINGCSSQDTTIGCIIGGIGASIWPW